MGKRMGRNFIDLTGKRFGRLVATENTSNTKVGPDFI